jgi:hypothetical protein
VIAAKLLIIGRVTAYDNDIQMADKGVWLGKAHPDVLQASSGG